MEPRARVSVWPGRRRVPGIVAPDSWGARGAECLPRDVLRRSTSATSPCDGMRRADVCAIEPGPAPRKHAPLKAVWNGTGTQLESRTSCVLVSTTEQELFSRGRSS